MEVFIVISIIVIIVLLYLILDISRSINLYLLWIYNTLDRIEQKSVESNSEIINMVDNVKNEIEFMRKGL